MMTYVDEVNDDIRDQSDEFEVVEDYENYDGVEPDTAPLIGTVHTEPPPTTVFPIVDGNTRLDTGPSLFASECRRLERFSHRPTVPFLTQLAPCRH